MQAIIAAVLANLPAIIALGKEGFDFVQKLRAVSQQTGEWTPEQEAEFQSSLSAMALDPAWQPHDVTGQAATVESQTPPPAPPTPPVVAETDTPAADKPQFVKTGVFHVRIAPSLPTFGGGNV